MYPLHISHFLLNNFRDSSLLQAGQHFPLPRWSAKWRSQFHELETETLLCVDRLQTHLLNKSLRIRTFCTPVLGLGYSQQDRLGLGAIIGYYNRSLVYEDLSRGKKWSWTCEEHTMSVTRSYTAEWGRQAAKEGQGPTRKWACSADSTSISVQCLTLRMWTIF